MKNNTFNDDFFNNIFIYYYLLPIFEKYLDFHKS